MVKDGSDGVLEITVHNYITEFLLGQGGQTDRQLTGVKLTLQRVSGEGFRAFSNGFKYFLFFSSSLKSKMSQSSY